MALVGTFSVAPNGRLDAVWYDTRNAANNTDSQLFYSFSTDAGVTWSPNVAVSNAFNPFEGYPNQSKIGDYITIVSDETGGNVATRLRSTSIQTTDSTKKTFIRPGITYRRTYPDTNTDGVPDCNSNAKTYSHSTVDSHAKGASYAASSAVRASGG